MRYRYRHPDEAKALAEQLTEECAVEHDSMFITLRIKTDNHIERVIRIPRRYLRPLADQTYCILDDIQRMHDEGWTAHLFRKAIGYDVRDIPVLQRVVNFFNGRGAIIYAICTISLLLGSKIESAAYVIILKPQLLCDIAAVVDGAIDELSDEEAIEAAARWLLCQILILRKSIYGGSPEDPPIMYEIRKK